MVALLASALLLASVQSQTCDMSSEATSQMNDICCAGGGHRRSLQECQLTICSEQCAELFVPFYDGCRDELGDPFPDFYSDCNMVMSSVAGTCTQSSVMSPMCSRMICPNIGAAAEAACMGGTFGECCVWTEEPPPPPPPAPNCVSAVSCEDLTASYSGWPLISDGSVCGESDAGFRTGELCTHLIPCPSMIY